MAVREDYVVGRAPGSQINPTQPITKPAGNTNRTLSAAAPKTSGGGTSFATFMGDLQKKAAEDAAKQRQEQSFGNRYAQTQQAVAPAAQATAAQAAPVAINMDLANAIRGQQMQNIGQLQAMASGQAPSAAQLQMQQGLDKAIAAQQSAAASARGINPALAARMASQGTAQAQTDANAQAAQLRAQEQAQAQQSLANAIAGVRSQDTNLALQQAGMGNQAGQFNAQLAQQMGLANMGSLNDRNALIAQLTNQQLGYQNQLDVARLQAQAQQKLQQQQQQWQDDNYWKNIGAQALGGAAQGLGEGLATLIGSDARIKKDIEHGDKDVGKFLDALRPYSYRYKDEAKHGEGPQFGVMAQDLEKSEAGKASVKEIDGVKMVDTRRLALAIAGAAGDLHRRVKKLEAKNA